MQKVALAQGILSDSNTPGLRDHPALSVGNLPSLGDGVHPLVYSFLLSRRIENCSQATITSYKDRISCMMRFVGKDPLAITKADIEFWLLHLRESESRRGGKRSAHFIRSNFNAVRPFFNWLVAEGHLDKSPVANMKPPKVPKYEKEFLSEEEFHRLLSLCSNHTFVGLRDRAWLWLLWSTGCRFSELANLKRDDLFFMQNGRIVVTGKGNKQRAVPFTDDAQKAVFRYLQKRDDKYPELWISEERRPMKRLGMGAVIPRLMDAASGYQCPHCGKEYEGLEFT
ncbi:MAG: tyrosine-type recombinase/integrase, partial [Methanotrichaceae archaeon]|nr:tyrosine-type recombinase/integrase [Methanotrichaceae archaeon]